MILTTFICIIILFQFLLFTKTSNKIRELKIFIGENFTLSTMEDGCKSLSINPEHDKTSVTAKCLSAINMYLKNKELFLILTS